MMATPSKYEALPWHLIIQALQEELTPEENELFGAWLATSHANQATYQRLQQLWKERLSDYPLYAAADPDSAWGALQQQLATPVTAADNKTVFHPRLSVKLARVRRWSMAAVLIFLVAGIAIWQFRAKQGMTEYATTAGEQRTIPLPDGSTVVLGPQSHLQLHRSYNKTDRTVFLLDGQAHFDVVHLAQQPFVVDMDNASVRDIGTSFIITKNHDSITVTVTTGKIAFTEKATGKTQQLSAGSALRLYTALQHNGEMVISGNGSLRFDNARLSEVVDALQKQFGQRITLQDSSMARKRLTVHLDGESFDSCIKVVCAMLSLESVPDGGGIILKAAAPNK